MIFWITGPSGSGKTTFSLILKYYLNWPTVMLDGDYLRKSLSSDLGFSDEDRRENMRRVGAVAQELSRQEFHVICSFVSPSEEMRQMAFNQIEDPFILIYMSTPLSVCAERDPKGLYAMMARGEIKSLTGSNPYEPPINADFTVDASESIEWLDKKAQEITIGHA